MALSVLYPNRDMMCQGRSSKVQVYQEKKNLSWNSIERYLFEIGLVSCQIQDFAHKRLGQIRVEI